jgi:hypothetical protein
MGSSSQFNWWAKGLKVGVCFKSLPPNNSFLDGPLNASSRTRRNRRREKRKSQKTKNWNTSEETNDVQIGITYEGITNDIQVGEA